MFSEDFKKKMRKKLFQLRGKGVFLDINGGKKHIWGPIFAPKKEFEKHLDLYRS